MHAIGRRAIHIKKAIAAFRTLKGRSSVSELLAPLRLRSGATTVISAILANGWQEYLSQVQNNRRRLKAVFSYVNYDRIFMGLL